MVRILTYTFTALYIKKETIRPLNMRTHEQRRNVRPSCLDV